MIIYNKYDFSNGMLYWLPLTSAINHMETAQRRWSHDMHRGKNGASKD